MKQESFQRYQIAMFVRQVNELYKQRFNEEEFMKFINNISDHF